MVELSDRLIPLLKEYDLPNVLMALSWQLMGAVNLASKATTINRELHIADIDAGAEQSAFEGKTNIADFPPMSANDPKRTLAACLIFYLQRHKSGQQGGWIPSLSA
jgi:hypothetical protein